MKQNRWSSKVMWASIIAQIVALCQLTGVFQKIGIDAGYVGDVTASILQLLVIIGVLNNPTDSESF